MKMTKEAKVWVGQEELRYKSCLNNIKMYEKQIEIIKKTIELERQQARLVFQGVCDYKAQWDKA